ncbi:hypothetical protein [Gordonia sp. NPDC003376]
MTCPEGVAAPGQGVRGTAGDVGPPFTPAATERPVTMIRSLDGESDPVLRPHIARVVAAIIAARELSAPTPASWTHALEPVAGSVGALVVTRAADAVADLLRDHVVIALGEPDRIACSEFMLGVPCPT